MAGKIKPGKTLSLQSPEEEVPSLHYVLDVPEENLVVVGGVIGTPFEICPIGIFDFDPEADLLLALEYFDSGEEVAVETTDVELEIDLVATLSDDVPRIYAVLDVSRKINHDVVLFYSTYVGYREDAMYHEEQKGEQRQVVKLYPEVVGTMRCLIQDPFGTPSPIVIDAAITALLIDSVPNARHRQVLRGLGYDLYAQKYGPLLVDLGGLPEGVDFAFELLPELEADPERLRALLDAVTSLVKNANVEALTTTIPD